jgi:hypothetical protein
MALTGKSSYSLSRDLGGKLQTLATHHSTAKSSVRHSLPSDHVNKMTMAKFAGPRLLPKDASGTILGIVPSFTPGGEA